MIEAFLKRWGAMALRERRMVLVASGVVAFAILWMGLFEPAWNGRRALHEELPVLRTQVAQMSGLATVAQQAQAQARAVPAPEAARAAIETSLKAAGLSPSVGQFELNGERISLKLQGVAGAAAFDWLDAALRETRMRVVDASVTREARPGFVSVRLVLEAARRDKR